MEIALYARVSTTHQQQTQTIDQQLTRLRAAVATHPDWHLAAEHIYCDEGHSGAKLNRPGLDRLRDHAAMAAFEGVLITAPDRLARKYVHQMLLVEELTGRGCRVDFVDRPMSDDPHDQLLLQIRGAVAEYERTLIADRMRRGRHAKLRSGVLLPWSRVPYGYLVDPEHPRDAARVRLDPVKAALVEQLFAWYTDPGEPTSLYGLRMKLHALGITSPLGKPYWSESTLRGLLRSPTYTGTAYGAQTRPTTAQRRRSRLQPVGSGVAAQMVPREEWIGVTVPAIVSTEIWQRAQARLDENKRFARRNNHAHEYLLRGLVYCGRCQYGCSGRNAEGAYRYYICSGRRRVHCTTLEHHCPARYIPADRLDAFVWQDLCQIIADPTMITHELTRAQQGDWLPQALQARRHTLSQTLAQLDRQQQRLLDVFLAEVIGQEEFERKREELGQTQEALRQQLRHLEAQAQHYLDVAALGGGITDFCARIQSTLKELDFAQRRKVVELLIDAVVVTDGAIEIRYVIPTGPAGEQVPFCHLRKDYFDIILPRLARVNAVLEDT